MKWVRESPNRVRAGSDWLALTAPCIIVSKWKTKEMTCWAILVIL